MGYIVQYIYELSNISIPLYRPKNHKEAHLPRKLDNVKEAEWPRKCKYEETMYKRKEKLP